MSRGKFLCCRDCVAFRECDPEARTGECADAFKGRPQNPSAGRDWPRVTYYNVCERHAFTVFVDFPMWSYGRMTMCHMFSYDLDRLHAYAEALGLRRWFQHKPGSLPHYDVCKTKRAKALLMGTKEASRETLVEVLRHYRREHRLQNTP